MKKMIVALSFSFLFIVSAIAQNDSIYTVINQFYALESDMYGTHVTGASWHPLAMGWQFKVVNYVGGYAVIQIFKWPDTYNTTTKLKILSNSRVARRNLLNTSNAALNSTYVVNGATQRYFVIYASDLRQNANAKYPTPRVAFNAGTIVVPIKIRFGSDKGDDGKRDRYFDFTGNVNLGLSAGFKIRPMRTRDLFISVLGGASISSIPVDSLTTNGYLRASTNASAFTPSIGFLCEYKDFQFGAFLGKDYLARELGDNWDYSHRLWLGFGLGYNIFTQPVRNSSGATNSD